MVVNSLEIHADTFQLADLQALRFIRLASPPAEQLAATAMSPDASRLAVVTSTGEVWLYAIDHRKGEGSIVNRYDFGTTQAASGVQEAAASTAGEKKSGSDAGNDLFTAATFIDANRLALAGARAGILVADITNGSVIWSRSPILLPGYRQDLVFNESQQLLALYGERSAQLLSPSSGALLSDIVDFEQLAKTSPDSQDDYAGVTISIGPGGRLGFQFKGVRYEPADHWSGSPPNWKDVEKRTAIGRSGQLVPLAELLDMAP